MGEVVLKNVRKVFGETEVIHGVDIDINKGEFVVFVGPSGCGKSTLLRLVAGLEDITEGELRISGKLMNDVPPAKRGIAMVFQSYALYPHMTVRENMAFGLKLSGSGKGTRKERVDQAARILQIEHLLARKPKELSGGQRQRVAIGRAIVRKPDVFLFDEPLSNLDASLRVQMRIELGKLHNDLKTTMIYVTHDQVEAMTMADKIVVLSGGHIEQCGAPLELYHYPCNLFVAGFIGSPSMNFLSGEFVSGDDTGAVVKLKTGEVIKVSVDASGGVPGSPVTVGVRPEHVFELGRAPEGSEGGEMAGDVKVVERLGECTLTYLETAASEDTVVARVGGDSDVAVGERIKLKLVDRDCHLFDESGRAFQRIRVRLDRAS